MKICIAQIQSEKGQVLANIQNHLKIIKRAIQYTIDVIIFPELSITNYEPTLTKELATSIDDDIFNPFQEVSNKYKIAVGIGMPIKTSVGIHISMLIFQPKKERLLYSKRILHQDELPYFVSGRHQPLLTIKGVKIALGICYETLQRTHFVEAKENDAEIYIASVAKPDRSLDKAYIHFPSMSKEFKTPILMANSVGVSDDFISNGSSAVWNTKGELLHQLDENNQGILVYDTKNEEVKFEKYKIEKAKMLHLEELHKMYVYAKDDLIQQGIYQWTTNYPNSKHIKEDIKNDYLYILKNNDAVVGAICLNEIQDAEYEKIDWQFKGDKILVIHRLVIKPNQQHKGYAKDLMDFAEQFAIKNGYSSIRLDAFTKNKRVLQFYKNRDYQIRGQVYFPERKHPFYCLEKAINTHSP